MRQCLHSCRGDIIIIVHKNPTSVAFKNCGPFIKCITKIDGTTIGDADDLDLVMLIYILIEYSSNYSEPRGSLWFHSKEKATTFNADIANNNIFKFFSYKIKLLKNTVADGNNSILKNAAIVVPFKYVSNFWSSLEMPLIKCNVELKRRWTKHFVLAAAGVENDNADSNNNIFTN